MPFQVQVPSATRLLRAWETGFGMAPARQALLVLAACCPDASADALAALPVGARNRLLITAHLAMFSPVYDCVADCPCCGCLLQAELPVEQVIGAGQPVLAAPGTEAALAVAGHRPKYRLPTAGDLAAVAAARPARAAAPEPPDSGDDAASMLVRRCLLEVDGVPAELPEGATNALAEALTAADPDAVLSVRLTCPECGTSSDPVLDPVTFLWADVDDWAWRLLGEVHELARGYGWDEDAILAMSPGRRGVYLSLLTANEGHKVPVGGRR